MRHDRRTPSPYSRLRTGVQTTRVAQAGDTMIEVLVAALLVVLIAVATFTAFIGIAHVVGGQNTRAQASALAEADQARLHGMTLDALVGTAGNTSSTQTIDNTVYTITSSSQFTSASGAPACTAIGTSTADEVQTTSTVTWASDAPAGGPVEIHSLMTPPEGGSLTVRVVGSNGSPVSGSVVSLSGGPTSAAPLTTDANGCVEFGGLAGGTYTVSTTLNGVATSAVAPTVVPTKTSTVTLTTGGDGGISATFTTTYNGSTHASSADQVVAWNSAYASIYNIFGTASSAGSSTYQSTVNSGSVYGPGNYQVYAGSCAGDASTGGEKLVSVASSTTSSVSLPQPAMIVNVYGSNPTNSETDDAPSSAVVYSGSHWTHGSTGSNNYASTESFDSTAGDYVTFTFTGTSIEWIAPLAANGGYADVYIDGTKIASNVSTYTASTSYQQVIWSDSGLSNSTHTIKIYVDGTIPPGSSSTSVAVDAFISGGSELYDDDVNPALSYSGTWTHANGSYYTADYDSDESYSNTTNNSMTMTFTGTAVEWLGSYASNHGIAYVYLDGTKVATVDGYAATSNTQQDLWSTSGLTNTTHTLQIVVSGTKNAASGGYFVSVDAIVLGTSAPTLLTSAPVVTITDNNSGCTGENYPATQVPTATQGALVDPGQPYGNDTVCASYGGVENTATVANTSYTTGNPVSIYLSTGSPGLTTGSCT